MHDLKNYNSLPREGSTIVRLTEMTPLEQNTKHRINEVNDEHCAVCHKNTSVKHIRTKTTD